MKRRLPFKKILDIAGQKSRKLPMSLFMGAGAFVVTLGVVGQFTASHETGKSSTNQLAKSAASKESQELVSHRNVPAAESAFEAIGETTDEETTPTVVQQVAASQDELEDNPYGSITSDELHQINPEQFSHIRSYEAVDFDERLEQDTVFQSTVKELVKAELSRPESQIGEGLMNVMSDEANNARRIIDIVQSLENEGVLVDIEELSFTRLDEELSTGIFGSGRKIDRVVSQQDDFGNEHLSMAVLPDENVTNDLSISAPVSTGFSYQIVSSNGAVGWFGSWKGHIIGYYQKYKDFGERDNTKDYFAYHRRSLAKPLSGTVSTHLGPATSTYYVSSADLQSGVTNSSAWKIISRTDQDPWNTVPSGSAVCSNASIGISYAGVSASTSGKWCDTIIPRRLWGGLHTRYEANHHWWHGWSKHKLKEITNNFMVGMSVEPGTTPYWWDYNDAYFCNDGYRSDYQKEHVTAIPNDCHETTRNQ